MNIIAPIETLYKGYRFRSRLEARWAVFFDTLGIDYLYESEGYESNGLRYLPDFFLPKLDFYVEIKPRVDNWPDKEACDKAGLLTRLTGKMVYILCGEPYGEGKEYDFEKFAYEGFYSHDDGGDNFHFWCICDSCMSIGIQYSGFSDRNEHTQKCSQPGRKEDGAHHPRLINAYIAARSARFEFGENGR